MELIKCPLFNGVSLSELNKMIECFKMEEKQYFEKQEIQMNNKIGIIISGNISLNRINIDGSLDIIEYLGENEIFGTFINQLDDNNLIAICEKKCMIITIDSYHITKRCHKACSHHSLVVENLLNLMTEKVNSLNDKIKILSYKTIREKLLAYMIKESEKNNSATFTLPFSYSYLANYLCIDRSAMTRELKKLKNEQLIYTKGRDITLNYK